MNVSYEHKIAMTFIGYHTSIRPDEGYAKCPEFWDNAYARRYARLWQTMTPHTPVEKAILDNGIGMFAICNDGEGAFEYWIAGLYRGGEVPEGLSLFTFPESDWAVFSARGPLPGSLQALNTQVFEEWFPDEGKAYQPEGSAMLEVYSAGDMRSSDYECGIWVPVRQCAEQETAETVATMTLGGIL